jgi:membrane protein DedA with SNARE-associated domain
VHLLHGSLTDLLQQYGYGFLGLVILLESMGVPLPGESLVIAATLYAAATHRLSVYVIVPVVAAGAIIGDNLGFLIGHWLGSRLLVRYGRHVGLTDRRMKLGRYLFRRYGAEVVFFGRFIAFLRTFAALLAGANGMEWRRFLVWNAAGGVVWASLYGFGAYVLGRAVERLRGPFEIGLGVVAVIAVIAGIVLLRRNETRWEERAEREMAKERPGRKAAG